MTFIKRLMEIKEEQLEYEEAHKRQLEQIIIGLRQILKVLKGKESEFWFKRGRQLGTNTNATIRKMLKGRKDGKRKISRKDKVPNRFGRG